DWRVSGSDVPLECAVFGQYPALRRQTRRALFGERAGWRECDECGLSVVYPDSRRPAWVQLSRGELCAAELQAGTKRHAMAAVRRRGQHGGPFARRELPHRAADRRWADENRQRVESR